MRQHRLKLITLLLFVAILIGLTCAGSAPGSTVAQSIGELTAADVMRLAEVERVLARFGNEIWPGWSESLTPLLLRKGEYDYLIGHPNPPEAFEQIPGVSIGHRLVFRRWGHLVPVPAATTWEVNGVWCVAVPTLEEFQQGLDEKLGTGVVNLDNTTYVQVVAHEGFHAFTMTTIGGMDNLPNFGPEVDPQRAVDILATIPDLDARFSAEGQALRDGITAQAEGDAVRAGAAFLQMRRSRHADHPDLVAFEQTLEWTEGLARYADVSLKQLAGSPDYTGMIHYPNSVETWQEFLAQLSDPASIPTGLRDRYAILGAGEAFLLDRLMPDWKAKAIPGKTALEELLAEAMTPEPLRSFRVETVELAGEWLTVAVANCPEQWKQGLSGIADLGALDGLLFSFPGDVTARFWMKDALMPLDAAFFAGDGSLITLMRMELCAQDSCPTYGSDHPFRWVLESPAGRLTWLPAQARLVAPKE